MFLQASKLKTLFAYVYFWLNFKIISFFIIMMGPIFSSCMNEDEVFSTIPSTGNKEEVKERWFLNSLLFTKTIIKDGSREK